MFDDVLWRRTQVTHIALGRMDARAWRNFFRAVRLWDGVVDANLFMPHAGVWLAELSVHHALHESLRRKAVKRTEARSHPKSK